MITEIIAKVNFLDFIILIILIRICYISAKMGLSVEIFKFFGVVFSTYIALHYYVAFSDLIQQRFLPEGMSLVFMDFTVFIFLITLVYLCFIGLRSLLLRFVQLNAVPKINQYLGLILGVGRGFLLVGLLSFTLVISGVAYLTSSVKHSYLGNKTFIILPQTYVWLWSNIFSKFSAKDEFNSVITKTTEKFYHK